MEEPKQGQFLQDMLKRLCQFVVSKVAGPHRDQQPASSPEAEQIRSYKEKMQRLRQARLGEEYPQEHYPMRWQQWERDGQRERERWQREQWQRERERWQQKEHRRQQKEHRRQQKEHRRQQEQHRQQQERDRQQRQ
jgi:hypothetical protein